MIYSEIRGRCGNQMFTYAISRKLEKFYGSGMTFNFYLVNEENKLDKTWKNDLVFFNVNSYCIDSNKKQLVMVYGSKIQKIVFGLYTLVCRIPYKKRPSFYKRQEKMQPVLNYFGIYDMIHGYSPLGKTRQKNQFICGTYEDERFFLDIKEDLRKEFTTKKNIRSDNIELYNLIMNSESVCVSFRRGDFLNKDNKNIRDICGIEYYYKAIKKMKEIHSDAKFFFFSDEIEWVRENCDFDIEAYYESGEDDIGEKMRLMSACKHFIMSNSTFCWWAQFLSINKDKTVISPDHWFNMEGYKHQLISDEWILIKC